MRFPLPLFSVFLTASSLPAVTRYVTPGGGIAGTGTSLAAPWSLAKAATSALPGDLVLVQPGTYAGKYEITVSGNATDGPITFRADGAAGSVIIDGTGLASSNDGLIFIRARNAKPIAAQLVVEGFDIRNYLNVNDGSGIRILSSGTGAVSDITIRNCRIYNITGRNAMGITVYGTASAAAITGITITGCEIYDCQPSPSETLVLNGNVDGFLIENCRVRDCNNIGIDLIGGESGFPAAPAAGKVARNGVVRGCHVSGIVNAVNVSGAGIYVDGGRSIVIENNLVETSDFGIELGAENPGIVSDDITVRNNVLRNNLENGLVVGAAEEEFGRVQDCRIYNNLLYQNGSADTYSTEIFLQYGSGNVFENNIIWARADGYASYLYVIGGNTQQTFRNNLWYSAIGNGAGDFGWVPEETDPVNSCCGSYAQFRAVTGQDTGGMWVNPQFANAAGGDYHLGAASPARNAGTGNAEILAGGLTDFDGFPRVYGPQVDIGPDEAWPVKNWLCAQLPALPLVPASLSLDSDGDGAANLLEYAAGTPPLVGSSAPQIGLTRGSGAEPAWTADFRQSVAAADVALTLSRSEDLATWSAWEPAPISSPAVGGFLDLVWPLPGPVSTVRRQFVQVRAVLAP